MFAECKLQKNVCRMQVEKNKNGIQIKKNMVWVGKSCGASRVLWVKFTFSNMVDKTTF